MYIGFHTHRNRPSPSLYLLPIGHFSKRWFTLLRKRDTSLPLPSLSLSFPFFSVPSRNYLVCISLRTSTRLSLYPRTRSLGKISRIGRIMVTIRPQSWVRHLAGKRLVNNSGEEIFEYLPSLREVGGCLGNFVSHIPSGARRGRSSCATCLAR